MIEDKNRVDDKARPMNILLAEDNPADVKIILEAFAKAKLKNKVYVTENGAEALDFIYHKNKFSDEKLFPRPDLIILDIKMPKVDGFSVLEKIKNDPGYSSIPVIILTCSKQEEDTVKSFKGGACAYISKSDDPAEFSRAVEGFDFFWHAIHRIAGQ
jgi:two-component system response regulator